MSLQDLLRCFTMSGVDLTSLRYKAFVKYSEAGGGWYQPCLSSQLSAPLPFPATHPKVFPDLRTKEKLLPFKVYSKSMGNKQTHPQRRTRPQLSTRNPHLDALPGLGGLQLSGSAELIHSRQLSLLFPPTALHLIGTDCKKNKFRFKNGFRASRAAVFCLL